MCMLIMYLTEIQYLFIFRKRKNHLCLKVSFENNVIQRSKKRISLTRFIKQNKNML
jgi:hypothetical protein